MAKSPLKPLDPMDFTAMTPERERRIAEASYDIPRAPGTYKPNRLAQSLHPAAQHVLVTSVRDVPPHFKEVLLEADPSRGTESLAWFEAGQYVSVEVQTPAGLVTRPFSLCCSPKDAERGTYRLVLERCPGGLASDALWDSWAEGTQLRMSAPQGQFTYQPLRDAPQVMALVGGSSITPIFSLAKAVAEGTEPCSLTILYGTNTFAEAVLADELEQLCAGCDRLRLVHVLRDEEREGCEHGLIDAALVERYRPEGAVSFFVCGPQPMQRALDAELPKLGVAPKFIRREVFGEYRDPEKDEAYPGSSDGRTSFRLTVRIAGEEHELTCDAHDTLLNSMEHQGIHAPARCRSGECGWCHSRLVSGEVYCPERVDGRREADKTFGYVHPCATFPLSDIVLEVPPFAC